MNKKLRLPILVFLIVVFIPACKKSTISGPIVKSVEYRFISTDPNIIAYAITFEVKNQKEQYLDAIHHVFSNLIPGDTIKLNLNADGNTEFLNSVRTLQMKVTHKNKVYSPVSAAAGVYIDGNPYLIGWHYSRVYDLLQPDTVLSASDSMRYFHLPKDTLLLKEILW